MTDILGIALMTLLGLFFAVIGFRHIFGPLDDGSIIAQRRWAKPVLRLMGVLELLAGGLMLCGILSIRLGVIGAVLAMLLALTFTLLHLFLDRKGIVRPLAMLLLLGAAVAMRGPKALNDTAVDVAIPDHPIH